MRTRLVAVTISDPAFWVAHRACAFAREAAQYEAKRLGVPVPAIRLEIDARYLGPGYGHPTDAGRRALALAAEMGITLDLTYTAKAFAAALDRLDQEPEENVLFWHTLSSAPMDPWLTNAPAETELDASLRALLR
jgi:1-aminocyclopropane-1-carboxylate deaminase/D-cysteine desulfhydrase-like pyridoxal-dependent ACC family enzyme